MMENIGEICSTLVKLKNIHDGMKPLISSRMYKREKLTYVSPSSVVNPSFWNKLTELKLNVDRLEETERPLWGYLHLLNNNNLPTPFVEVDSTSFNDTPKDTNAPHAHSSQEKNQSKTLTPNVCQARGLEKTDQAYSSQANKCRTLSSMPLAHCSKEKNKLESFGRKLYPVHSQTNYKSKNIVLDVPKVLRSRTNDILQTLDLQVSQAHSKPKKKSKIPVPINRKFNSQNIYVPYYGKIVNKNTIEQFRECNKLTFLQEEVAQLYKKIISGEALKKPAILNCFVILAYADLKKYNYRFWFAFPVLNKVFIRKVETLSFSNVFNDDERLFFFNEFMKLDNMQKPFFLIDKSVDETGKLLSVKPIAEIKNLPRRHNHDLYFGFLNISPLKRTVGSQLKNYVALISQYCPFLKKTNQKFIALQFKRNKRDSKITIEESSIYILRIRNMSEHGLKSCTGWEKNSQQKLGPKVANLRTSLDPLKLAETSVDLNLKLMKWRAVPDLDLEKIKKTKCLILGAGTLGCSVARSLLAWGVQYITFVDNSTVSFSNPVRQSLFTYEDSVNMRSKAEAAAEGLKKIYPGVHANGVHLTIPMPGHSIGPSLVPQAIRNMQRLVDLIDCADVIFLLLDSRESRWLPTMFGNFLGKTVINAAVGFDSYLVMRHGYKNALAGAPMSHEVNGYKIIEGHNLACYFCNDVTAPGNTMSNRTLDQQCTVTRPGIAQIASALAVELAMSILQHKQDHNAPAFYKMANQVHARNRELKDTGLLGLVPHSIRGFLSDYEQIIPATLKYDQCVACSDFILDGLLNRRLEFLFQVFNSSKHLEDVAQLTEMFYQIDPDEVFVLDDEISDDDTSDPSSYPISR